jgi:uncharacterized protein YsxB (DUF464 family)
MTHDKSVVCAASSCCLQTGIKVTVLMMIFKLITDVTSVPVDPHHTKITDEMP